MWKKIFCAFFFAYKWWAPLFIPQWVVIKYSGQFQIRIIFPIKYMNKYDGKRECKKAQLIVDDRKITIIIEAMVYQIWSHRVLTFDVGDMHRYWIDSVTYLLTCIQSNVLRWNMTDFASSNSKLYIYTSTYLIYINIIIYENSHHSDFAYCTLHCDHHYIVNWMLSNYDVEWTYGFPDSDRSFPSNFSLSLSCKNIVVFSFREERKYLHSK